MKRLMSVRLCLAALTLILMAGLTVAPPTAISAARTVTVAISSEIGSLDTHESTGVPAEMIRRHIFEGLVRINARGRIEPVLATNWEVAADQRTWTFHLRPGVRFHDGTLFNAQAVKVNLDRVRDPNERHVRRAQYRAIQSVDVVGPYTVRIVTEKPYSPLLVNLAYGGGAMMSPTAIAKYGREIGQNPVGTGPYRLEALDPGISVTLVRNDRHWGPKPTIERLRFLIVKEASTRLAMLETGEVDVASDVPPQDIARFRNNPRVVIERAPTNLVLHLIINTQFGPLRDKRVRQALNYAVNRQSLSQALLFGMAQPARSVVASTVVGYANTWNYTYDPARAQRLLREAGVGNGFDVVLLTPDGRYPMDKEIAVAIQSQLAQVGIRVQVQVVDWGGYLRLLLVPPERARHQLALLAFSSPTLDISWLMDYVFNTRNFPPTGANFQYFSNPDVDRLIDQALETIDDTQRQAVWKQVQQVVADQAPWVLLLVYDQAVGHARDIAGLRILPDASILLVNARITP